MGENNNTHSEVLRQVKSYRKGRGGEKLALGPGFTYILPVLQGEERMLPSAHTPDFAAAPYRETFFQEVRSSHDKGAEGGQTPADGF